MNESLEKPGIDFLISNLSLPKPLLLKGSVADHEQYLTQIGASGQELTPVQPFMSRFMRRLLVRSNMANSETEPRSPEDEALRRIVRSGHSSFRDEVNDNGLLARTVPIWSDSLDQLRRIQGLIGPLPLVLYPRFKNGQVVYDEVNAPARECSFQPAITEWRQVGLTEHSSIGEVEAAMVGRGFNRLTFDVAHIQGAAEDGTAFKNPHELAQRLAAAGFISEIHLSVNRLDVTGFHSDLAKRTRAARKAFRRGVSYALKTPEGEMLQSIAREWHRNPLYHYFPEDMPVRVVLEDGPFRGPGTRRAQTAIMAVAKEIVWDAA